jgi:hypothetical protein
MSNLDERATAARKAARLPRSGSRRERGAARRGRRARCGRPPLDALAGATMLALAAGLVRRAPTGQP